MSKSILDKAAEIASEFDKNIVLVVTRDAKTGKVDVFPYGNSQIEMFIGMAAGEQAKHMISNSRQGSINQGKT
jgi:hypothetical protein